MSVLPACSDVCPTALATVFDRATSQNHLAWHRQQQLYLRWQACIRADGKLRSSWLCQVAARLWKQERHALPALACLWQLTLGSCQPSLYISTQCLVLPNLNALVYDPMPENEGAKRESWQCQVGARSTEARQHFAIAVHDAGMFSRGA